MTPYSYHAINTDNQAERLRQRDEIRLAARLRERDATEDIHLVRPRRTWALQALHGVVAVLTQPIRL